MRTTGVAGHHVRWRPRLGAILEAGAAVRTLVARLVTGGDQPAHRWRPSGPSAKGTRPTPDRTEPTHVPLGQGAGTGNPAADQS